MRGQFALPLYIDLSATCLYAVTGALLAIRRHYDVVGLFVLALVSGVGGGLIRAADFRNRASEGCPEGLECRRRTGRTCVGAHAPATSDRMHSRRKEELKTQGIKSSFSRDAKNCLTRHVRNYSVRAPCGLPGKPMRAESWGTHPSWKRNVTETT